MGPRSGESPPRVLIVDDVPENIEIIGDMLSASGYRVDTASGGDSALEMAAGEEYDLVLLDIMMPGMDGYEVCAKLKGSPQTSAIPVIFITARKEFDDIKKGFEAGAVDYITKPFRAEEVRIRTATHVELKRTRDKLKQEYEKEKKLREELSEALSRVKTLTGLLPICCYCHKIKDDDGYWQRVEDYICTRSDADFTHGICTECSEKLMKELENENKPGGSA